MNQNQKFQSDYKNNQLQNSQMFNQMNNGYNQQQIYNNQVKQSQYFPQQLGSHPSFIYYTYPILYNPYQLCQNSFYQIPAIGYQSNNFKTDSKQIQELSMQHMYHENRFKTQTQNNSGQLSKIVCDNTQKEPLALKIQYDKEDRAIQQKDVFQKQYEDSRQNTSQITAETKKQCHSQLQQNSFYSQNSLQAQSQNKQDSLFIEQHYCQRQAQDDSKQYYGTQGNRGMALNNNFQNFQEDQNDESLYTTNPIENQRTPNYSRNEELAQERLEEEGPQKRKNKLQLWESQVNKEKQYFNYGQSVNANYCNVSSKHKQENLNSEKEVNKQSSFIDNGKFEENQLLSEQQIKKSREFCKKNNEIRIENLVQNKMLPYQKEENQKAIQDIKLKKEEDTQLKVIQDQKELMSNKISIKNELIKQEIINNNDDNFNDNYNHNNENYKQNREQNFRENYQQSYEKHQDHDYQSNQNQQNYFPLEQLKIDFALKQSESQSKSSPQAKEVEIKNLSKQKNQDQLDLNYQKQEVINELNNEEKDIVKQVLYVNRQNANKNILKAFQKYVNDNLKHTFDYKKKSQNSYYFKICKDEDIITNQNPSEQEKCLFLKKFNKFISSKSYTNQHIKQIITNRIYGQILFKEFISNDSLDWLEKANVNNKQQYKIILLFYKMCCLNTKLLILLNDTNIMSKLGKSSKTLKLYSKDIQKQKDSETCDI